MSPKIEYDPGLVERAVQHAVRAEAKLETALHRQTDPLYELPPSKKRDAAFVGAFGAFFERLGLDAALRKLLDERPFIGESVGACIVGPALRGRHESAELLVRGHKAEVGRQDRTLMLQMLPQTLADPQATALRMRPELVHISDMVDPAFRYRRSQIEGLAARKNLIRDRYRVLWDVYVRGRLVREGFGTGINPSRLRAQLGHVFGVEAGEPTADFAFAQVFDAELLTHDQLFAWANSPTDFCGTDRATTVSTPGTAGANCPLCGFSTFDWFAFDTAQPGLVRTIENRHPTWAPDSGACRQCAEIYASA